MPERIPILVVGATGKQGGAVIDAILQNPSANVKTGDTFRCIFKIYGLTRNASSEKAQTLQKERGVVPIEGDLADYDSIVAALRLTEAKRAVLITDWVSAGSPAKETEHGRNFIKAVEEVDPHVFVLYCSVGDADKATKVDHFTSKFKVEEALKGSTVHGWFILRPVAFFELLDDPANRNPLVKGKVKMLTYPDTKLKYVSTVDIGKALANVLIAPTTHQYHRKTIEFAMDECTGHELAQTLTDVSGVECTYGVAVPRMVLWLFHRELYHMVTFFEETGYSADIAASRELVPDGMDAKAWFQSKDVDNWQHEGEVVTKGPKLLFCFNS